MKKQNYSLLWTVAFHLTLSAICVTANTLYRKDGDVELSITGENDGTIGNELISADLEDENSVHGEYIDQERVCLIDGDSSDNYRNFAINPHHELPLNVHTKVTLECNGPSVKLTVGGHVYTAVQPNHRFAGKLLVYAGNTYEQNANAEINGFEYEILPATKAKADVALLSDMQVQTPKDETSILHRENEDN
ncbi:hypothetical protein EMCRGX_G027437 [Ephydatia muelleri]